MNHKITPMFVVKDATTLLTSGSTADLVEGQVGVFNSSFAAISAAPSPSTSPFLFIAQGTGLDKIGSWKTPKIYLNKVTSWYGTNVDTTGQEQITYVGFDEINDCKSPSIACDRTYNITIRVQEHYLQSVYAKSLQEGVTVKSACCEDCSDNCDSLDAMPIFTEFAEKFNSNPRLSKYVTASVVSKLISGSPATLKFALVLPDPGTNVGGVATISYETAAAGLTNGTNNAVTGTASASGTSAAFDIVVAGNVITAITVDTAGTGYVMGETITIAGTSLTGGASPADDVVITVLSTTGAEGLLLDEIKAFYGDLVDDTDTDIVITADAEGDQDSGSTGNIMIELTPSAGVTLEDMEPFEGIEWTELPCAEEGTAVYAVGLKLVGITPDGPENDCLPDSIPYLANKTRFKVYAGEGPLGTQLAELPNYCDLWDVTTTQEVSYPIGEAKAIAEMERNTYGWKAPYAHRYWISYFNDELKTFTDDSLSYDMYFLEYTDPSPDAFSQKDPDGLQLIIAVPEGMTSFKTSLESILNTYLANSPAYQAAVVL